jgi:endonuclease YncB( thermonuclease family)
MFASIAPRLRPVRGGLLLSFEIPFVILVVLASAGAAHAAGCSFAPQGEGRVAEIVDGRSFRLTDGREIRLAGIEATPSDPAAANKAGALTALLAGHDVTLRGEDDTPDRYGRQSAFVFLAPSDTPVQSLLLAEGEALVNAEVVDKECAGILMKAEAEARLAKKGTWNRSTAIKNAEISDDILTGVGRFAVVEGRVLSVRQAGATTYLNFGRNWTRDFAVTISRRTMPAIEAAGIALKSLENRQIRVRGFIEARTGPRIELLRAGQIEVLGDN